ncbi:MAG TPA: hypothetical protein VGS20_05010 [Candidatus Acidoferrales bacterium]|nr:hypothetical protein [Candidatus Acidoferrales bacterium]
MADLVKIKGLADRAGRRTFSDSPPEPDRALAAEGWERRFTADAQRVEEVAELYRRLGYEVRAESLRFEEVQQDCTGCHSAVASKFKTIYTRRKAGDLRPGTAPR